MLQEKLEILDQLYANEKLAEAGQKLVQWIQEAEQQGDLGAALSLYNEQIGLYRTIGREEEAVGIAKSALELVEKMGLAGTVHHATTLLNGATANRVAAHLDEALTMYQQAEQIYLKLGEVNGYQMASLCNNISQVYQGMKEHEKALEYLDRALELISTLENCESELATTQVNRALSLMALKKYGDAEQSLEVAMVYYRGPQGKRDAHYGAALAAAGELAYYQGRCRKAESLLIQALEVTQRVFGENEDCRIIRRSLRQVQSILNEECER